MRTLENHKENPKRYRYTGTKTPESLDSSRNKGVPADFWLKHAWADSSGRMCDPNELLAWVRKENLEYLFNDIAPWFTTAMPINIYDRRYWSYNHDDGTTWISRTCAQTKRFYLKGKPVDTGDRCVICYKLLLTEYHVFMPVYMYEENPTKMLIWEWQDSNEKACYMHFHSSKCEYIEGRNPRSFRVARKPKNSRYHDNVEMLPRMSIEQAEIVVPDEY